MLPIRSPAQVPGLDDRTRRDSHPHRRIVRGRLPEHTAPILMFRAI